MTQCPLCRRNFKVRPVSITQVGVCSSCWRVWTNPTFEEVYAATTPEIRTKIREFFHAGIPAVNVAAYVKREFGLIAGIKVDAAHVIFIDSKELQG